MKNNWRIRTPSKPPGKNHMASLVDKNIEIDHDNYFNKSICTANKSPRE